ncbi:MAG: acyl transferase [Bacteroidota bacterium]
MATFITVITSTEIARIFKISSPQDFESLALRLFQFQYRHNKVYHSFCNHLNIDSISVKKHGDIPFLPISFFKSHRVTTTDENTPFIFESSGTTGSVTSKHFITDISLYEKSFLKGFEQFYGPVENTCILALLPSYLERQNSSLVYMANRLIKMSKHQNSGFYLTDLSALKDTLQHLESKKTKSILIGVSFALLDFATQFPMKLSHCILMETGGMKGRRKEMIREELHSILKNAFGLAKIHSEYGMTELLSQAYSKGDGLFKAPPWMKVCIRDTEDPLSWQAPGKTGGINIIDLTNAYSCPFIATQDLGKMHSDGKFEVLGRFDHADVRGCNLMAL